MALFIYVRTDIAPTEQPLPLVQHQTFTHTRANKYAPSTVWSESDKVAIARTLAGECYDDKVQDKRLVCEVILNRVSDTRFANSVIGVLETPNAFDGYWRQSRRISKSDLSIAEQALSDWYANDCQPLSDIRYFSAGEGRENYFH